MTKIKIVYRQLGKNYCLGNSLASCLHYADRRKAAGLVAEYSRQLVSFPGDKAITMLNEWMGSNLRRTSLRDRGTVFNKRSRKKQRRLQAEQIVSEESPNPTLMQLIGNDGSGDHAVAVVDNLIFDARLEHALTLSVDALNWVCGKHGLKAIGIAVRFDFQRKKKTT